MKKNSIYITGFPGFKSAVTSKLGNNWEVDTMDINQQLLRFDLPRKMTSEEFRLLIGENLLVEHNILFLYNAQ